MTYCKKMYEGQKTDGKRQKMGLSWLNLSLPQLHHCFSPKTLKCDPYILPDSMLVNDQSTTTYRCNPSAIYLVVSLPQLHHCFSPKTLKCDPYILPDSMLVNDQSTTTYRCNPSAIYLVAQVSQYCKGDCTIKLFTIQLIKLTRKCNSCQTGLEKHKMFSLLD